MYTGKYKNHKDQQHKIDMKHRSQVFVSCEQYKQCKVEVSIERIYLHGLDDYVHLYSLCTGFILTMTEIEMIEILLKQYILKC